MSRTTSRNRGLLMSRSVALPIVAIGLLALAPWQAAGLFQRWQAMAQSPAASQPSPAQTLVPPAPSPGPNSAASEQVSAVPGGRSGAGAGGVRAQGAGPSPSGPSPSGQRPADGKLLEELNRRAAELDRREHDLRTWAAQVAVAERLARAQLAELAQLRAEVEKVVARESAASDEDIAVLVGLYSNMKPTQAAAVLGRLDAAKAAAILEKLDIHSAGPALAAMDPMVAVAITEELSRRHAPFRR